MGLSAVVRSETDPDINKYTAIQKGAGRSFQGKGAAWIIKVRLEAASQIGHYVTDATFIIINLLFASVKVINFCWPHQKMYTSL